MECTVCLIEWHSSSRVPRMLQCGHSFCEECIIQLFFQSGQEKVIQCPACLIDHPLENIDDIKSKLIKNYTLLSLVETSKSQLTPKPQQSLREFYQTSDMNEEEKECSTQTLNPDRTSQPRVKFNQKCSQHPEMVIHSQIGNDSLLCTRCIFERNLPNDQINVIPQVIRDIKFSIESTKTTIFHRRHQLTQAMNYLKRVQRGNAEAVEARIRDHFNNLKRIVQQYEDNALKSLKSMAQKQNEAMQRVQYQIDECLDKLQNDDLNLSSLESHDDNEIIYMTKIIEDQRKNLEKFETGIELGDDITIGIQLNEIEKIESMVANSCVLFLNPMKAQSNDEKMTFDSIIQKDRTWVCQNCNSILTYDKFYCETCQTFKPLEMYKNLLNKPEDATQDEISQLNERRKLERKLILDKDMLCESPKQIAKHPYFYMISSEWLNQWKYFISNTMSEDCEKVSVNPMIGVLPPGPIVNDDLLVKGSRDSLKVRNGLEVALDYRGVSSDVWEIFMRIYGGGPAIIRQHINDIYSKDMSSQVLIKVVDKNQFVQSKYQINKLYNTNDAYQSAQSPQKKNLFNRRQQTINEVKKTFSCKKEDSFEGLSEELNNLSTHLEGVNEQKYSTNRTKYIWSNKREKKRV